MGGLNYYSEQSSNKSLRHWTQTISVTSGKGGVGKTTVVINMAQKLARMGKRVLILDGDFGMANIDVMLGLHTPHTLYDVLQGSKELSDVIIETLPGIDLIPGGSGIYEVQSLSTMQKYLLMDQVSQLKEKYDVFLLDTAPGIDDNVLYLNAAADEVLLLLTPDPSSLTDAYALIKVLNQRYKTHKVSILCNMVQDQVEAKKCFKRLSDVASQFLNISLDYKGFIPYDNNLKRATKSQQLVVEAHPKTPASFAFQYLVDEMCGYGKPRECHGGMQFFWQQLAGVRA